MEELYSEYCRNKLRSDSLVQKYTDSFFQVCVISINVEFNNNLINIVIQIKSYLNRIQINKL